MARPGLDSFWGAPLGETDCKLTVCRWMKNGPFMSAQVFPDRVQEAPDFRDCGMVVHRASVPGWARQSKIAVAASSE